jgi:hypothetical protein
MTSAHIAAIPVEETVLDFRSVMLIPAGLASARSREHR